MTTSSRLRYGVASGLVAVLLGAIAVIGVRANFRTAASVDSRTYIEMIRGFADNGLPHLDNAPAADFAEGQARWNVYRGGHLWGIYPPLFPWLAALPFRAGGLPLVSQLNCIVALGLIVLGTAALGTRFIRDPLAGAACAYATLGGTFVGIFGLGLDSFALCTAFAVWSCYCGLRTIDDGTPRWAVAAGATGGCAVATHLLAVPLLAGVVAAVAVGRRSGEPPLLPTQARDNGVQQWFPSRPSLWRAVLIVLASAVALAPVAWVNHLRFGAFSPATYGPCVWRVCTLEHLTDMTLGASLVYAMPVGLWLGSAVVAGGLLPRRRWRWPLVAILAVAPLLASPALRRHGGDLFACAIAYIVDNAALPMPPFTKPADGLGNFFGLFAVKSLLQGSPYLALAFVAPWIIGEPRRVAALLFPAAALLILLGLRGNLPLVHALGFPFLVLRYLAPALPILAVLAVAVARAVGLRRSGWVVLAIVAVGGAYSLWDGDDAALLRRVVVLRGTLIVGIGAAGVAVLRRRWPVMRASFSVLAGIAFGLAVAISIAIDVRAIWRQRVAQDAMLARIERQLPYRLALVGWPPQLDPVLSLRASHDIEYLDFYESENWGAFRTMIDRWTEEGRPIYAVFPRDVDVQSPWANVSWEVVDAQLPLVRVRKR